MTSSRTATSIYMATPFRVEHYTLLQIQIRKDPVFWSDSDPGPVQGSSSETEKFCLLKYPHTITKIVQ
jgi:hypothetical protein